MSKNETQLLLQLSKDIKENLKQLGARLDDHLTKDEKAWEKVAKIEGQLGGMKWVLGVGLTLAGLVLGWLGLKG